MIKELIFKLFGYKTMLISHLAKFMDLRPLLRKRQKNLQLNQINQKYLTMLG